MKEWAMNVFSMFELKGQKALVTGGGQGIGRAISLGLAEAGADVAVAQRHLEVAEKTAGEIAAMGRQSLALQADVSKSEDVTRMVRAVKEKFGRIDILVNNAGMNKNVPAEDMPEELWDQVLDTNLKSAFLCSQAVGREMIQQKKGNIINVASIGGTVAIRPNTQCHYNSSKMGMIGLTRTLAMEWCKHNIRVNAIAPGYTLTDLLKTRLQTTNFGEQWLADTMMHRMADPEEMKGVAVFLASAASSFVTGAVIVVDGGYSTW
jgi:NAD(P)-dependent dehydrogenase (short-subunit alcohol dehydrogenase family)